MTEMKEIQNQKAQHKLLEALDQLDQLDSDFKAVRAQYGNPSDRFEEPGFPALVRIILGQQISRAVAHVLWTRMQEKNWIQAEILAALSYAELQAIGLSKRKSEYIIDLARAEAGAELCLSALASQPAEEFTKILIGYRGIGSWTIHNYRLFCLADMDAWPGNDLALMETLRRVKHLKQRPNHLQMDQFAKAWQPCRGAAALLLWHFYACVVRDARPVS